MKISSLTLVVTMLASPVLAQEPRTHGKAVSPFAQEKAEEQIVCIIEKEKVDDPFIRLCELIWQLEKAQGSGAIRFNGVDVTDALQRVSAALLDLDFRLQALEKKQ